MSGVTVLPAVSLPAGSLTKEDLGREITINYLEHSITGRLTALTENPDGTVRLVLLTSNTSPHC